MAGEKSVRGRFFKGLACVFDSFLNRFLCRSFFIFIAGVIELAVVAVTVVPVYIEALEVAVETFVADDLEFFLVFVVENLCDYADPGYDSHRKKNLEKDFKGPVFIFFSEHCGILPCFYSRQYYTTKYRKWQYYFGE